MIDFFASITIALIIIMTVVILISNQRQAHALNQMRNVLDSWFQSQMRDRRERQRGKIKIEEPFAWFSRISGVKVSEVRRQLHAPPALELLAADGTRVVVSPLAPDALRKALRPLSSGVKGRTSSLVEPLLGRKRSSARNFSKSPEDSGEWFDLEAQAALQAFGLEWPDLYRLWVYVIVPEAERQPGAVSLDFSGASLKIREKINEWKLWLRTHLSKSSS